MLFANAQIVNIPDANFKYRLVNHIPVIDTNGDGEIQVSEAVNFTDSIDVGDGNISDLIGIEAFTQITGLYCWINQLTSIDVSNNTALKVLRCGENQLINIDISNNTDLIELGCGDNLSSLDISNNTALESLWCGGNQLTTLDVSNNPSLKYLHCSYNPLGNINVSNNTALIQLYCDSNLLTTLDISNNINLTNLSCNKNQLSVLNVNNNTNLEYLACISNQLTNIDFSNNDSLETLVCSYNPLTTLDLSYNNKLRVIACLYTQLPLINLSNNPNLYEVHLYYNPLLSSLSIKNGTNTTNLGLFIANHNPNLTCIEVDDSTWSTANWTDIDPQSYFSEICMVSTPNQLKTQELKIAPNPFKEKLSVLLPDNTNADNIEIVLYNVLGKQIKVSTEKANNEIIINGANLHSGIYFVELREQNRLIGNAKLIKQ